jgi:zinc/manganese transport system substrate-binding protein
MKNSTLVLALPISAVFALSGCVAPSPTDANGGTQSPSVTATDTQPPSGVISVVASTSVWASIVEFVGGDAVEVTAIISDPNRDPHSYEASARDQLAVNEAELVVMNGGGYDDFMIQLVQAAPETKLVLEAVEDGDSHADEEHADEEHGHSHADEEHADEEHGHSHADEEHADEEHGHSHAENEHVWYDFDAVSDFAVRLADVLAQLRPESLQSISTHFDEFEAELEVLALRRDALRDRALGLGMLQTAPLASLLLVDAGFIDLTPSDLLEAVEEEREIAPLVMAEAETLLRSGDVSLLAVNEQLLDPQSEQLIAWAEQFGAAIVYFSELIPDPENQDYLDWMHAILDELQEKIYG